MRYDAGMSRLVILSGCVLAVAACGDDGVSTMIDAPIVIDAPYVDAAIDVPPLFGDFTCAGMARPTTAPDPLAMTGRVRDPVTSANVGGGTVSIHRISDDGSIVSGLASGTGVYALNVTTGGTALGTYRKAVVASRLDAYAFDPFPVHSSDYASLPIYSITQAEADGYYQAAGVAADPARGTILVEVVDCVGAPVVGVTVSAAGAIRTLYLDGAGLPAPSATATDGLGQVLVLGAPAGNVDVTVNAGDVEYRAWPVKSVANSLTFSPRYP